MSDSHILLISGSLRAGSTNTAVVRTAAELTVAGVSTEVFEGLSTLPYFNPDDDVEPLPATVSDLRNRLGTCDAVLVCTPEYAGALPGAFKNLLDWTVGGGTYGKPVAWINASTGTGAVDVHESLRKVFERTGTDIVDEACARVPVARHQVGADGRITDQPIRDGVAAVLRVLAEHVGRRKAAAASAQTGSVSPGRR